MTIISIILKTTLFKKFLAVVESAGFPLWWTAPNLILNILFQHIFVHRILKSQPFFKEINSF